MDLFSWTLLGAIILISIVSAIAYFSIRPERGSLILLSVSCLPLFFDPASRQLTLMNIVESAPDSGVANGAIHFSVLVVPLLAVASLATGLHKRKGESAHGAKAIVALAFLYTISIFAGLLMGAGWVGLAFYLQTMLPLVAFFSVLRTVPIPRVSPVIVASSAVTMTVVIAVGGIGTIGGVGYGNVNEIVSIIPQFRSYFSIVPTVGLAFAIAGWTQHRKLSATFLVLCAIAVPLMWSRTGLAMMAISAGVAFLARPGATTKATKMALGGALGVAAGLYAFVSLNAGVIGERDLAGSTVAASGASRAVLAVEALERVLSRPILGDSFVPYSDVLAGGTQVDVARLFPAHNQYLDIALRGGVVALVLFVILLVGFGARSMRLAKVAALESDARFHAGLLAVICSVALGNVTHLFLVQPWSGILVFALLGIGATSTSRVASEFELGGRDRVSENPEAGRKQDSRAQGHPGHSA